MITQVEATNSQGSILVLPLYDVSAGLIVEDIEGLDPVKATLVTSSFAQLDGTVYQSSRRDSRNIKLKLGLEPDYSVDTVKSLRSKLYRFFMPKSFVSLRIIDSDGVVTKISGRVESCEAPLFTDLPGMDVSIICFDPDFVDVNPTIVGGGVTTSGEVNNLTIDYPGTVEAGIEFKLSVNQTISIISLYQTAPDGTRRQLDFISPLLAGDVLTINTTPGAKQAMLKRGDLNTSILYGISPQSNWIELKPGANKFRMYAATATPIPFQITYTSKYGGL